MNNRYGNSKTVCDITFPEISAEIGKNRNRNSRSIVVIMHAQTHRHKIRIDEATVRSRKLDSIPPPGPDAYRITEIHGALASRSTRLLKTTIGIRTIERSRRLRFFRDFLDFVKRINEHVSIARLNFQILIRRLLDNDTANDAAVLQMHGLYILGRCCACKAAENEKQKQLFHKN